MQYGDPEQADIATWSLRQLGGSIRMSELRSCPNCSIEIRVPSRVEAAASRFLKKIYI
jgi:hypothetical protein